MAEWKGHCGSSHPFLWYCYPLLYHQFYWLLSCLQSRCAGSSSATPIWPHKYNCELEIKSTCVMLPIHAGTHMYLHFLTRLSLQGEGGLVPTHLASEQCCMGMYVVSACVAKFQLALYQWSATGCWWWSLTLMSSLCANIATVLQRYVHETIRIRIDGWMTLSSFIFSGCFWVHPISIVNSARHWRCDRYQLLTRAVCRGPSKSETTYHTPLVGLDCT